MGSQAVVTPGNFELTPMRVKFDGVDLGGTLEGVVVGAEYKLADLVADQFGTTILDQRVSGKNFTVKYTLAEINKKENWKIAFPHSTLVSTGTKAVHFDMNIGDSLLAHAKVMILHPLSKIDADLTGDYKIFKAAAKSASEVKYGPEDQTGLAVEMMVFPDTSYSPAKFMIFGDPSIGLVAASAGSPSFTGTGNGVMSAVSAGAAAVTETITVTLVTEAANGGVFYVEGSVSGAIGLATVGTPFTSSKINFSIADGSTDFVEDDVFSIAMTGANYI